MRRNARAWVLAGALTAVLAAPAPAHGCMSFDVSCASSVTQGTVDATLDESVGDEVVSTVDDAVGSASGTVDDVVGAGDDAVDDVFGEGSQPTEPGIDRQGPARTDEDRRRDDDGRESVAGRIGVSADIVTPHGRHLVAPVVAPVPSLAPASAPAPPSRTRDGYRDAVAAAAPSLFVLVALFGIVMAFLLVQSWMDRRDPRLAAAPPADEMAWFR